MRRTQLVSSVERVIQYAMENASEGIFIGPLDNTEVPIHLMALV